MTASDAPLPELRREDAGRGDQLAKVEIRIEEHERRITALERDHNKVGGTSD